MQESDGISPYRQVLRGKSKRTLYEINGTKEGLLSEGVKEFFERRTCQMEHEISHCRNVMEIIMVVYRNKVEEE